MDTKKSILNVPKVASVEYSKNLIDTAVCELRFPTLLSLESLPPTILQERLRKIYPDYEVLERPEQRHTEMFPERYLYEFSDKKNRWIVTIKSTAITLKTQAYTNFEDFIKRLEFVLESSIDIIDSDYFTRVGLRYTNHIPTGGSELKGWINDNLLSSYNEEVYGSMESNQTLVAGYTEHGRYYFRHGLTKTEDEKDIAYLLDYDHFKEYIEYDDVLTLVKNFNETNFSFFQWSIGPKTINIMGKSNPKKGKKIKCQNQ